MHGINSNQTLALKMQMRMRLLARIDDLIFIHPVSLLDAINEPNILGLADKPSRHSEYGLSAALHLWGHRKLNLRQGNAGTALTITLPVRNNMFKRFCMFKTDQD